MNGTITVYPSEETKEFLADWIRKFEHRKYTVLVDFKHGCDADYFNNHVAGKSYLYTFDKDFKKIAKVDIEDIPVDLMICFNEDENPPENCEDIILAAINGDETAWPNFEALLAKPVWIKSHPIVEETKAQPLPEEYRYREFHHEGSDCLIVEIIKPYTDKPYTTLIKEYSKKGGRDVFCNFYACPSWGVSDSDTIFLQKVWESKLMVGVFDCNVEVAEKIRKVESGIEEEPKVWRNTLDKVLEIITATGYKGLGKRAGSEIINTAKK